MEIVSHAEGIRFYQDIKKEWRWRITASNGRNIGASTEGYINKIDALNNFLTVGKSILNSPEAVKSKISDSLALLIEFVEWYDGNTDENHALEVIERFYQSRN